MELVFKMPDWMVDELAVRALRRIFVVAGYRDDEDFDVLFGGTRTETVITLGTDVKEEDSSLLNMVYTLAADNGTVKGNGADDRVAHAREYLDRIIREASTRPSTAVTPPVMPS